MTFQQATQWMQRVERTIAQIRGRLRAVVFVWTEEDGAPIVTALTDFAPNDDAKKKALGQTLLAYMRDDRWTT